MDNPKKWAGLTELPPALDIFTISVDEKLGGAVYDRWAARQFFSYVYDYTAVGKRKLVKFGEIDVYAPEHPDVLLDATYPKGWSDTAYKMGDHLTGERVSKLPFYPNKYKPALPMGPLKQRYTPHKKRMK